MPATFCFTEYDKNDTSMKDFYMYGIYVGQYRNDILARWALRVGVIDPVWKFKVRFSKEFGYRIKDRHYIAGAMKICEENNTTFSKWMHKLMVQELKEINGLYDLDMDALERIEYLK